MKCAGRYTFSNQGQTIDFPLALKSEDRTGSAHASDHVDHVSVDANANGSTGVYDGTFDCIRHELSTYRHKVAVHDFQLVSITFLRLDPAFWPETGDILAPDRLIIVC